MTFLAIISVVILNSVIVYSWWRDKQTIKAEATAWAAEQASITPEEREAAGEMLMDTLGRWTHALTPEQIHRAQTKEYAVAAVQWKKMREDLRSRRSTFADALKKGKAKL